jgi:Fibronectin type III domain
MTTRQISRLIISIAALTLIAVLLFSGSTASAGKADRSAPTTPANLVVTAITETTISLSWQSSTDNSGKFSYKVQITNLNNSAFNSLATVSQTQTTYTAKYLTTNSPYTFSVYAIDGSGNRSANSNLVSASTLADTTPPSGPVLQASVLSPSQLQLTWTKSTDNANAYCCNYTVNMNGAPVTQNVYYVPAPSDKVSVVIRHLQPGSTNSFSVSASDSAGGNVATSNVVSPTMPPSSDTLPPNVPTNLHLVQDNSCGEVWLGWTETTDNVDPQDSIEYEIYVNGVLSPLPVSAGVDFDFVYATIHGDNVFTIRAVDRSGNTSADSAPIKLFLWPC